MCCDSSQVNMRKSSTHSPTGPNIVRCLITIPLKQFYVVSLIPILVTYHFSRFFFSRFFFSSSESPPIQCVLMFTFHIFLGCNLIWVLCDGCVAFVGFCILHAAIEKSSAERKKSSISWISFLSIVGHSSCLCLMHHLHPSKYKLNFSRNVIKEKLERHTSFRSWFVLMLSCAVAVTHFLITSQDGDCSIACVRVHAKTLVR